MTRYQASRSGFGNIVCFGEVLYQTPQTHLGRSAIWFRTYNDLPRASKDAVGQVPLSFANGDFILVCLEVHAAKAERCLE